MNPTAPASLVGAWPTASPFWRSRLHRYPSQNGGVREGVDPKRLVEDESVGMGCDGAEPTLASSCRSPSSCLQRYSVAARASPYYIGYTCEFDPCDVIADV
jgi:hypothetical protein